MEKLQSLFGKTLEYQRNVLNIEIPESPGFFMFFVGKAIFPFLTRPKKLQYNQLCLK